MVVSEPRTQRFFPAHHHPDMSAPIRGDTRPAHPFPSASITLSRPSSPTSQVSLLCRKARLSPADELSSALSLMLVEPSVAELEGAARR